MIELNFTVFSLLLSIALIIALTFGFLMLFSRHENKKADRFLALLMFIVALWNASILILLLNIHRYAIGIIWVPLTYTLALGPCFYFYILYMTDTEFNQKLKLWPHFIPVFFQVLIFFIEVFQGIPLRQGYYQTEIFLTFDPFVNGFSIISFMVYGYLARKRIQNYHQWVENNYSHYHRYHLNWLFRFSSVFMMFLALWLCYFLIDYFLFNYKLTFSDYYPFHLTLAIISIWLSVEAFSKPDVIYSDRKVKLKTDNNSSSITDDELQQKASWLKHQIEQNLLYLDPELSLKTLAETLSIHPNLASRIINDGLQQTFSDCINHYRVEAVIKKLKNHKNDKSTFLAIAFDCGFNSKTTFNRVFKKQAGKTPQQYCNHLM